MYLFHFTIMFMDAGSLTQPFYYSNENIVSKMQEWIKSEYFILKFIS